jgi:hypothetical protein
MGFAKLDECIIDSSIWAEPPEVRVVWITMLAKADADGYVASSMSGLQRASNVSKEHTENAVRILEAPDADSRTPDNEGRRIEKVDGGWLILNYRKYRDKQHSEQRRQYMRDLMRDKREAAKSVSSPLAEPANKVLTSANCYASASSLSASVPEGMQGEDAHTPTLEEFRKHAQGLCIPEAVVESCYHWHAAAGFCRGQTRLTNFKSLLMAWWAKEQSNPKKPQLQRPRMAI